MSTIIVILTILGGILQHTHSLTVEEVLAEYKPKVKELQNEAVKLKKNFTSEYRNAICTINKEKRNATFTINKKIADLKNTVKELEKNATSEGIDISTCLKNFWREIQFVYPCFTINKCTTNSLHEAWIVIYKLQCLIQEIGRITNSCLKKFPDDSQSEKLKECLEDSIKNYRENLDDYKTTFEEAFESALDKIRKCITEAVEKLLEILEKIWNNFEECHRNSKPLLKTKNSKLK